MVNMKNIEEIKEEIAHYRPSKEIAKLMLTVGKLGYKFSGHGTDFTTGEEDFSFVLEKDGVYSELSIYGKQVEYFIDMSFSITGKFPIKKSVASIEKLTKQLSFLR